MGKKDKKSPAEGLDLGMLTPEKGQSDVMRTPGSPEMMGGSPEMGEMGDYDDFGEDSAKKTPDKKQTAAEELDGTLLDRCFSKVRRRAFLPLPLCLHELSVRSRECGRRCCRCWLLLPAGGASWTAWQPHSALRCARGARALPATSGFSANDDCLLSVRVTAANLDALPCCAVQVYNIPFVYMDKVANPLGSGDPSPHDVYRMMKQLRHTVASDDYSPQMPLLLQGLRTWEEVEEVMHRGRDGATVAYQMGEEFKKCAWLLLLLPPPPLLLPPPPLLCRSCAAPAASADMLVFRHSAPVDRDVPALVRRGAAVAHVQRGGERGHGPGHEDRAAQALHVRAANSAFHRRALARGDDGVRPFEAAHVRGDRGGAGLGDQKVVADVLEADGVQGSGRLPAVGDAAA